MIVNYYKNVMNDIDIPITALIAMDKFDATNGPIEKRKDYIDFAKSKNIPIQQWLMLLFKMTKETNLYQELLIMYIISTL
jgi:hypothetical protein